MKGIAKHWKALESADEDRTVRTGSRLLELISVGPVKTQPPWIIK